MLDTSDRKQAMLKALEMSLGVVKSACDSIGLHRSTHYSWIETDEDYRNAVKEVDQVCIDFVESKMYKRINGVTLPENKALVVKGKVKIVEGKKHYPPDSGLIKFFLETKAKHKGYVSRKEITGQEGGPIIKEVHVIPSPVIEQPKKKAKKK